MKKVFTSILVCLTLCMAMCLTGCTAEFAKNDYDNNAKIASSDRVVKVGESRTNVNGNYTLKISSFNGRETIWSKSLDQNATMNVSITLSRTSGYVKVVHVDGNGNVTVLAECSQEKSPSASVTKAVSMTKGTNKLKLVGYDCKDVKLNLVFA